MFNKGEKKGEDELNSIHNYRQWINILMYQQKNQKKQQVNDELGSKD